MGEVVPLSSADSAASAKTAFNLGELAVDSALFIAYLSHQKSFNASKKSSGSMSVRKMVNNTCFTLS